MSRSQEDIERAQQTSSEERRIVEQKLQLLNTELVAAQKFIQDSPTQIDDLQKKFRKTNDLTQQTHDKLTLMDKEDDPQQYSILEEQHLEAKKEAELIDRQLKDLNQKFEQAKLDVARIQQEVQENQRKIELLNAKNTNTPVPTQQPTPSLTDAFRPQPTFQERRERTTPTTNVETTDKSVDIIKHLKLKCEQPGSKYHYDGNKKQIELVTPTNNTIIFTKNGASTASNNKQDLELMAKEFIDALVRDGKDLKTVNVTAQGESQNTLKEIFEKMKKEKILELQRQQNSLTQSITSRTSERVMGRVETDQTTPPRQTFR